MLNETDQAPVLAALRYELQQVVLGQEQEIEQALVALLAGGHLLLEGPPGVGKTLLARTLASTLEMAWSRVQFTPDLMPADITGVTIIDPKSGDFKFRPGPIFTDLLLADELNRAPARTQAALLEAMQERQVTLDGETHALSPIFTVIATQNPFEYEGTYGLPEAQLDRFLMKVVLDYPRSASSLAILEQDHGLQGALPQAKACLDADGLKRLQQQVHEVSVQPSILKYVAELVEKSRTLPQLTSGASPRASVMLLRASKALALLRGRNYVIPEDVQELAGPVLAHRLRLSADAQIDGVRPQDCIDALIANVAVPS